MSVVAEADVILLKLREVLILEYSGQAELGERPFVCCESFDNVEKPSKKKIVQQNVKGKMADTYNYISGDLLCALLPLFVDGILRNTNKKKFTKWRHQTIFANFLVLTRAKCLFFSNKRKGVKIGQKAFTLNQGDTLLVDAVSQFLYWQWNISSSKCWSPRNANLTKLGLDHSCFDH